MQHSLFIDTHVHFRKCFPRSAILDAAATSFALAAQQAGSKNWVGVLALTESATENAFKEIAGEIEEPDQPATLGSWGGWQATLCDNRRAIHLVKDADKTRIDHDLRPSDGSLRLVLVAGRQIDTSERLEVSALGSDTFIPDGQPIEEVLAAARSNDTYQILPWAPGKWSLARGKLLDELISRRSELNFALGDNGGRPRIWPEPRQMRTARRLGIPIFPGSDPLPFDAEMRRIGSYGVRLSTTLDFDDPARHLIELLRTGHEKMKPYGKLSSPVSFFGNEIMMQITKKKRKRAAMARTQ